MTSHLRNRLILILVCLIPGISYGTLGEDVRSISRDHQALGGLAGKNLKATSSSLYTAHELIIDGITIREYTDSNGIVFAVTWRGLSNPDLSVLLGQYHSEYQTLSNKKYNGKKLRGPRHLKSDQLVIIQSGHMRDLHGRAFAPQLVPAGVKPEDLP